MSKKENPRPRISHTDRLFWIWLSRTCKQWRKALIFVQPETVVKWHRKGFRLYWTYICNRNRKQGRPWKNKEIRDLIHRMAFENVRWGAPRIHGKLLKLGYDVSERTVSRYMPRREPSKEKVTSWKTFLKNHMQGILAIDFFTVPTLMCRQMYVFFILQHERRKILHFNVTYHPAAAWVAGQIQKALSLSGTFKYMIHDNAGYFAGIKEMLRSAYGIKAVRTSLQSPWQNGFAERWIRSARQELLRHVIVFSQKHLHRLLAEYVEYYNNDRTHYSLEKDSPMKRPILHRASEDDTVIVLPRLGGLHHKYVWKKAA